MLLQKQHQGRFAEFQGLQAQRKLVSVENVTFKKVLCTTLKSFLADAVPKQPAVMGAHHSNSNGANRPEVGYHVLLKVEIVPPDVGKAVLRHHISASSSIGLSTADLKPQLVKHRSSPC